MYDALEATLAHSGEEDITSPRKVNPKVTKKKGKHSHTKMWLERLEKAMRDLWTTIPLSAIGSKP